MLCNYYNLLKPSKKFLVLTSLCSLLAVLLMPGISDPASEGFKPVLEASQIKLEGLQVKNDPSLKSYLDINKLFLHSEVALVLDQRNGAALLAKNIDKPKPIASLTKLMTAMVVLDAHLPLDEVITIKRADRDRYRGSRSKLSFGTKLTRRDMLKIALANSENRAARALARTFPGGPKAIVAAMNAKAKALSMKKSRFKDAAGLWSENVSTALELSMMVEAAYSYDLIRKFSTLSMGHVTDLRKGWKVKFMNTNRLVRGKRWEIGLSKTGYLADAGNCLVMQAKIVDRPVVIVLLNSWGKLSKFGDANRIKKWIESADKKVKRAAKVPA